MKFNFLGGAMEVGGSSVLIGINGKNILCDAGIRQSAVKDAVPDYKTVQEKGGVDYIIVSHAHMDHIGTLPVISKAYPSAPIFMNTMTKMLTRVLLYDSLKIMEQEADIPKYCEEDVVSMLDRIIALPYNAPYKLCDEVKFAFYPAGHIAGASMIHIMADEGSVLYTGDYSGFAQRTIEGAFVPKINADVMITETTYGTSLHSNRQAEENKIISIAEKCIQEKGKMLIPVFALGRAQEVLMILKNAISSGKIPEVNIYVDGMVRQINSVYQSNPLFLKGNVGKQIFKGINPFGADYIHEVKKTDNREDFFKDNTPAIFVASSGMLTGGASVYYAKKIISDPNGYIVITGYQDEEAPGRAILSLLDGKSKNPKLTIDGVNYPVNCHLEKAGLSAHADKDEIMGLIQKIMPNHLFLVHGDGSVIKSFSEELQQSFCKNIWLPECGEECDVRISGKYSQRVYLPKFKLTNEDELNTENASVLRSFVLENYGPAALFTAQQLFYIWHGRRTVSEKKLAALQNVLLESGTFEPNPKRLFQFRPKTEEEKSGGTGKNGFNMQDVQSYIETNFAGYPYRKISFNQDKQEVVLIFDFPFAVSEDINSMFEKFAEETGWKISKNDNTNTTALTYELSRIFDNRVTKISFFPDKKMVTGNIDKPDDYKELCEKFKKLTGFEFAASNSAACSSLKDNSTGTIKSSSGKKAMEQNQAFAIIDKIFGYLPDQPYKKGIKSDSSGKFIELAFISPFVGQRYMDTIKEISDETGWTFKISSSVNQGEIMNIITSLCSELEIKLLKNPSYIPSDISMQIKAECDDEKFARLKEIFKEKTGMDVSLK